MLANSSVILPAHSGSLTRAAFLSARNDAIANIANRRSGCDNRDYQLAVARLDRRAWDFAMNFDAARHVFGAARNERREALAEP